MTKCPNPEEDGITHINIYSKGSTELGRLLSNFAHTPFIHPNYGQWCSVEGLWYYLRTGCHPEKKLRTLSGYQAKKYGRELMARTKKCCEVDNFFKEQILEGIRCKLRQHASLRGLLTNSSLPFEHYYYYGSNGNYKVYDLPQFKWITEEIERIRGLCRAYYNK